MPRLCLSRPKQRGQAQARQPSCTLQAQPSKYLTKLNGFVLFWRIPPMKQKVQPRSLRAEWRHVQRGCPAREGRHSARHPCRHSARRGREPVRGAGDNKGAAAHRDRSVLSIANPGGSGAPAAARTGPVNALRRYWTVSRGGAGFNGHNGHFLGQPGRDHHGTSPGGYGSGFNGPRAVLLFLPSTGHDSRPT